MKKLDRKTRTKAYQDAIIFIWKTAKDRSIYNRYRTNHSGICYALYSILPHSVTNGQAMLDLFEELELFTPCKALSHDHWFPRETQKQFLIRTTILLFCIEIAKHDEKSKLKSSRTFNS